MSLLPSSPDIVPDSDPRVVGVDSETADELMSALSSKTARHILSELHDDPAPPAEVADRVDTSLQNTQYHLSNLVDAGAVEVVGTAYSEKGREMDVYAPADQPLVIFAGRDEQASGLRAALKRLLGAVSALAVGSLAIQEVFGRSVLRLLTTQTGAGGAGAGGADTPKSEGEAATSTATPTPTSEPSTLDAGGNATGAATQTPLATGTPTQTPMSTATQTPTPAPTPAASDAGIDLVGSLPPGVLFFLGGLTVLAVALAFEARR